MRSLASWVAALACLASGCNRPLANPQGVDPVQAATYEKLRDASFEFSLAVQSFAKAVETADAAIAAAGAKPQTRQALTDLRDYLNDAGATLSEFSDEPEPMPVLEEAEGGVQSALDLAKEAWQDAANDLTEAIGLLTELEEFAPPSMEDPIRAVSEAIRQAAADLDSAGTVLEMETEPQTEG